jgi:hypothetical protein
MLSYIRCDTRRQYLIERNREGVKNPGPVVNKLAVSEHVAWFVNPS